MGIGKLSCLRRSKAVEQHVSNQCLRAAKWMPWRSRGSPHLRHSHGWRADAADKDLIAVATELVSKMQQCVEMHIPGAFALTGLSTTTCAVNREVPMPCTPTTIRGNQAPAISLDKRLSCAARVPPLAMNANYRASAEMVMALDHSAWSTLTWA